MHDVVHHDIVKFGLIPELVGRLPVITALDDLDEESLVRIMTEPRNALIKQYQYLFRIDGIDLQFEREALIAVAKKTLEAKTGARGLRSIIEKLLLEYMYDMPSEQQAGVLTITEKAVTGEEKADFQLLDAPEVKRGKLPGAKAKKSQ